MGRRGLIVLFVCVILLASFVVYVISETDFLNGGSVGPDGQSPTPSPSPSSSPNPSTSPTPSPTPNASPSPSPTSTPTTEPSPEPSPTTSPSPTPPPEDPTVNAEDHEDPADYVWDSAGVIDITLNGDSITVNASGVATIAGSKVTVTSAGNYRITGSLTDGQVIVDTDDNETVRLILNEVNIACSTSSPILVEDAKKVIIVLQAGTENYVADGTTYNLEEGTDEPNAAVFSKADLTIYGDGMLTVDANYNDGVASKDGLIIKSGTVTVNAVDDGIRGKDYLVVKGGVATVNSGGDGLKSDNDADYSRGYVSVEAGTITVVSGGDAISGETDVLVSSGAFALTSGGGSNSVTSASAKGLKANVTLIIDDGTFMINSADDAVHSNTNIIINGGSFEVSTGDDAFHADDSLEINGGTIDITKCFEGLESNVITINNGHIEINSDDDGINVAGGDDGDNPMAPPNPNQWLHINGGYLVITAVADGIDSNGYIDMSGGTVIVNGPTDSFNAPIDYGSGTFKITGGTLIAVGSSGMAQGPSQGSTQYSVLINLDGFQLRPPTLIHLNTTSGEVFTFMPTKPFKSIVYSSPQLTTGQHTLYLGGSYTGTPTDGLYEGGTYTPGNLETSFIISGIVTTIGSGGGWGFP